MSISLFKSFGDIYDRLRTTPTPKTRPGSNLYIAEVYDVIMSKQHPNYTSDKDIGKILIREMKQDFNQSEEDLRDNVKEAYPLDVTNLRIPLPGEFAVVLSGLPGDFEQDVRVAEVDYYISTISNMHFANYNGIPFGATLPDRVSRALGIEGLAFIDQLKERHKKRFNTFTERQIKHLRPYDGDIVMQGRFGNSIRLGSTIASPGNNNPYGSQLDAITNTNTELNNSTWSTEGATGDPIIIMRTAKVDNIKFDTNQPEEIFTVENINEDGSSLYLCENQKVEVELQVANIGFKTWLKDLGVKPVENTTTVNDSVKQKVDGLVVSDVDDPNDQGTNLNEQIIL